MEFVNVSTQQELDQAIADGNVPVCRGNGHFVVSATVEAYGSATVRAYDSATVEAYDSATVEAYGSATVEAYGSATVEAYGSATVEAYGSATVRAYDSATVRAYGSATVRAYDSATVRAYDSATVRAYGSATVRASKYVAVHRHGDTPKVNGGVLIQVPACGDLAEFCEYYGIEVKRGKAILYKLVDDDFKSGHGTVYKPGKGASCDDWDARPQCGNGLHFSPRPIMARKYSNGSRFVACEVKVADAVVITQGQPPPDKIKAPACKVLYECDVDGTQLAAERLAA